MGFFSVILIFPPGHTEGVSDSDIQYMKHKIKMKFDTPTCFHSTGLYSHNAI